MPTLHHIRMLTRYNAWANQQLFQTLALLPSEELTKPRATIFDNMLRTLNHNYVVDQIWQSHLLGQSHGFTSRNTESTPGFADLCASQQQLDQWYIDYADSLSPALCDDHVDFEFVDGGKSRMRRGDILLHIVNHKTFHRGFVADMLYQIPAKPPVTDLPVFLRDAYQE